jgi:hypothetical protein
LALNGFSGTVMVQSGFGSAASAGATAAVGGADAADENPE